MRVIIDGIIFALQRVGGISTQFREITIRLRAHTDLNLRVDLPEPLASIAADELRRWPEARTRRGMAPAVLRYLPTMADADIVHTSYYRPHAARGLRVVSAYDFMYERYRHGPARWIHSAQKRVACAMADMILCNSEHTRDDLLEHYPSIGADRVLATPLAVNHDTFFPGDGRGGLSRHVLFVGQRTGYKRFDLAVAAVRATRFGLAMVGPPLQGAEAEALERDLPGRWLHLGRVDDAALRSAYAGAHAFIFPSDYEGFGLPILEAQACGCPAVVANRSSFPEVGGRAALYAERQEGEAYAALIASLEDDACRAAVVDAGLANAARFTWERTAALTADAYRMIAR